MADILSCPTLPSLPAVAVKVLELTSDPDIKIDELAKQIQNDQALATKILRTVNSSFYGLRRRCSSIEKALVYLGLGPVKSLVLGFSLVTSVKDPNDEHFGFLEYWQRGLHTAIASKLIADHLNEDEIADEAFLAGLCQDIGMIAMYRVLKGEYIELIEKAEGNHARLAKYELEAYEIQHSAVGAALAELWRLPDEIAMPVKYHDRPTACPTEYSKTARCVALGNIIHRILISDSPTEVLREAYQRAESWLGIKPSDVDMIILKAGDSARELASLFDLDIGSLPRAEDVLAKADRQLIELSKEQSIESYGTKELSKLLVGDDNVDPVTGIFTRVGFNQAVRTAFLPAANDEIDLTLVQVMLSGMDELSSIYGEAEHDEVVLGTTMMLHKHFEPMGGVVCRLADSIFGVVLPRVKRRTAAGTADECCREFDRALQGWVPDVEGADELIKVCMGVAAIDDDSRAIFTTPDLLVTAAGRAVQAAKASGDSVVRVFIPRKKAA